MHCKPVKCHLHKLGVECKGNDDNIMCCDTLVIRMISYPSRAFHFATVVIVTMFILLNIEPRYVFLGTFPFQLSTFQCIYARMKTYLADKDCSNEPLSLFTAAMVAGIVSLDNWEHCLI